MSVFFQFVPLLFCEVSVLFKLDDLSPVLSGLVLRDLVSLSLTAIFIGSVDVVSVSIVSIDSVALVFFFRTE